MHLELLFVGLAALAAAAPVDKISDDSMHQAQDTAYTKYAGYRPYYSYAPYSSAVEAEAAKMQQGIFLVRPLSARECFSSPTRIRCYKHEA
jgi:hypothetical protein